MSKRKKSNENGPKDQAVPGAGTENGNPGAGGAGDPSAGLPDGAGVAAGDAADRQAREPDQPAPAIAETDAPGAPAEEGAEKTGGGEGGEAGAQAGETKKINAAAVGSGLYRKMPVVIEAMQMPLNAEKLTTLAEWNGGEELCITSEGLLIPTIEGVMTAAKDDWIIRGIKGELYPVKPDIFAATYEPVGKPPEALRDPDGNPPSKLDPEMPAIDKQEENVMAATAAASVFVPGAIHGGPWDSGLSAQAAITLASFFRIFPDSPDEAGPTELKRFKIDLPEEHRPGLLLAMIRVFRVALDQLDRLDREDAARAEAAKPKPKPEQWREPKGFKQTKKAMQPGSGLKPRR